MTTLTYIASPYSSPDPGVMQARADKAVRFVAWAMRNRAMHPISPIAHSHEAAVRCDLPKDAAFWRDYNRVLFAACGDMCLLALEGWQESKGISWEVSWCLEAGKPFSVAMERGEDYEVICGDEALTWLDVPYAPI